MGGVYRVNSAGMLSTPADFPFFKDLTAASTSSRRIGKLSTSVLIGQSNTAAFPLVWLLYNSVQYPVHRLIITLSSVRHFPDLSWMLFIIPFFSLVRSFTTWIALFYCSCSGCLLFRCTVLLSIFLRLFSCLFFVDFPIFISSSGAVLSLFQYSSFVTHVK